MLCSVHQQLAAVSAGFCVSSNDVDAPNHHLAFQLTDKCICHIGPYNTYKQRYQTVEYCTTAVLL